MTARLQRWFKVIVFLLTREDSTISIYEKNQGASTLNTSRMGTLKALVWFMISIAVSFSVCLL